MQLSTRVGGVSAPWGSYQPRPTHASLAVCQSYWDRRSTFCLPGWCEGGHTYSFMSEEQPHQHVHCLALSLALACSPRYRGSAWCNTITSGVSSVRVRWNCGLSRHDGCRTLPPAVSAVHSCWDSRSKHTHARSRECYGKHSWASVDTQQSPCTCRVTGSQPSLCCSRLFMMSWVKVFVNSLAGIQKPSALLASGCGGTLGCQGATAHFVWLGITS